MWKWSHASRDSLLVSSAWWLALNFYVKQFFAFAFAVSRPGLYHFLWCVTSPKEIVQFIFTRLNTNGSRILPGSLGHRCAKNHSHFSLWLPLFACLAVVGQTNSLPVCARNGILLLYLLFTLFWVMGMSCSKHEASYMIMILFFSVDSGQCVTIMSSCKWLLPSIEECRWSFPCDYESPYRGYDLIFQELMGWCDDSMARDREEVTAAWAGACVFSYFNWARPGFNIFLQFHPGKECQWVLW